MKLPSIDPFYFHLTNAAQWIWKNRNSPQYWQWEDLTELNKAPDALKLSSATAWNIITVLESKKLIHSMSPFEKDGKKVFPFKIDLSDEKAWKKIRRKPTICNRLIEHIKTFWKKFWLFIIWIISIVVASSLTYGIKRLIDIKWPLK